MAEYKVIDNFLSTYQFNKILFEFNPITNYEKGQGLYWSYSQTVGIEENIQYNNMYFQNLIYCNTIMNEKYFKVLNEIIDKLKVKSLMRIKVNLFTRTENLIHHDDHCDTSFSHKGALFSLNTCDGFTVIDGVEIPSVANRVILFDPSIPHHSTNCTNAPHRMNINFNYF
tara:strand:- start:34 stop:543 length:510 start_codon:yes stop_codon:yes gene_type:complete